MASRNLIGVRGWLAGVAAVGAAALGLMLASPSAVGQTESKPEAPKPLKIGEKAPDFTLTDVKGKKHTLSDYTKKGKIVVLEWFNPGCPFVVKHYAFDKKTMMDTAKKYAEKDVVWLTINSTNSEHRDFAKNLPSIEEWKITQPVLMDTSGKVGKMYSARTTPHMYIVHKDGTLAYQGAIDSHSGPRPAGRGEQVINYVDNALAQLVAGETVTTTETRPYGCSVKYAN